MNTRIFSLALVPFFLVLAFFTFPVMAFEDLPLPLTSAVLEFALPTSNKPVVVRAVAKVRPRHEKAETVTGLKSLSIKIGSEGVIVPSAVLALFESPKLDTLRLYTCPDLDESTTKIRYHFAIAFRFKAHGPENRLLENLPTAWIGIKNGKLSEIYEIKDIRDGNIPSKKYDPVTLKPLVPERGVLQPDKPSLLD